MMGAWASSKAEVEEGRLQWGNRTQWALNRLSTSQKAVLNSNSLAGNNGLKSRICRYYNQGVCNFEGTHGNYRHVCLVCNKQGKSLAHAEIKCSMRSTTKNQDQQAPVTR